MTAVALRDEVLRVPLPTGELTVDVRSADWPLERLCGFGARNNPQRGFLIVSKVLGRHWPARPAEMRASARDLAARIPADLPGPVLVIGLAETAICLGQMVHEELRTRTGRRDIVFTHSTRQLLDHPLLCRFEEAHSHASAHLIYWPALPDFVPPRSIVMVDDEVSTGATLTGLAESLVECWPGIESICVATLTDWSGGAWLDRLPRPAMTASLLRGRLHWRPDPRARPAGLAAPAGALGSLPHDANHGRLGIAEPIDTPPVMLPRRDGRPLRILGTGEFTYLPFRLAERLERAGHDVVLQATSRSPARLGGALSSVLQFGDNYGTGVPNYLYNATRDDGRATWICHETAAASIYPVLVRELRAELVSWFR